MLQREITCGLSLFLLVSINSVVEVFGKSVKKKKKKYFISGAVFPPTPYKHAKRLNELPDSGKQETENRKHRTQNPRIRPTRCTSRFTADHGYQISSRYLQEDPYVGELRYRWRQRNLCVDVRPSNGRDQGK